MFVFNLKLFASISFAATILCPEYVLYYLTSVCAVRVFLIVCTILLFSRLAVRRAKTLVKPKQRQFHVRRARVFR